MEQFPMTLGLTGRVAIVTGAARGIGRATAVALARSGARLVACDIDGDGLASLMAELGDPQAHMAQVCDIGCVANCEALIETTVRQFGRLDILVNVAAVIRRMDIEDVDEAAWQLTMDVNLKSQFFLCRAASRHMKAARWGRIVNFTSQGAHTGGFHGSTVYAISKGGVTVLTKSLARQLAQHNICVNAIAPGAVDTAMMRSGMTDDDVESFVGQIPLGRMSTPEEQAMGVVFLTSEWAGHITGHTLDINGGLLMR